MSAVSDSASVRKNQPEQCANALGDVTSAALDYALRGWPVLLLWWTRSDGTCACGKPATKGHKPGKHPIGTLAPHGLLDATADLATVKTWVRRYPAASIGIRTGRAPEGAGIFVLDLDAGTDALGFIEAQARIAGDSDGRWLATMRARTGGGGLHLCYEYGPGLAAWLSANNRVMSSRNAIAPLGHGAILGLDVRGGDADGGGGYIVAPPSSHVSGGTYAWEDERPPVAAPEWPRWLLSAPTPRARPPAPIIRTPLADESRERGNGAIVLKGACERIAEAGRVGFGRHKAIYNGARTVGGYVATGAIDRAEAEAALVAAGAATGKDPREVRRTVADGLACGANAPLHLPHSDPNSDRKKQMSGDAYQGHDRCNEEPPPPPRTRLDEPPGDEPPLPDDDDAPRHSREDEEDADDDADVTARLNDLGNVRRLIAMHGRQLRWCGAMPGDGWLVFDGHRWVPDDMRLVFRKAQTVGDWWRRQATGVADENMRNKMLKWASTSESAANINAMVSLARGDDRVAVRRSAFDADVWLYNAHDATVDLRSGERRPHRPTDLLTRLGGAHANVETPCPLWEQFLKTVMGGDVEMIDFLKRAVGYSLTGDVSEQCVFVLFGDGSNGKGVFVETVRHILGDYAANTQFDTFTMKRDGGLSPDLAALVGTRLVTASEGPQTTALNEGLLKQLAGEDPLTVNPKYKNPFTYFPTFKVWLCTNHRPVVRGKDHGIWRRLRMIPFKVKFADADQDRALKKKLRAESAGILAWAIKGCAEWQANGLRPPSAVVNATKDYRAEMDPLSVFLSEKCSLGEGHGPTSHRDVYDAFKAWSAERGDDPKSEKWFGGELNARKIRQNAHKGAAVMRLGIAVNEAAPAAERPAGARASWISRHEQGQDEAAEGLGAPRGDARER